MGRDAGRVVRVEGERFLLGRAEDCDLRLRDDNVSRWHAYLRTLPGGGAELHDLESANGTYVDGERIEDPRELRGDEQIQVGDSVLLASLEEPRPERATRAGAAAQAVASPSLVRRLVREDSTFQDMLTRSSRRATTVGVAAAAVLALVAVGAVLLLSGGDDVADVVDRVAPATVLVEARDGTGGRAATGSGWVLDARAGLVVTNFHVVNEGETFRVGAAGRARPARVLAAAPCEDLAVLEVGDRAGLEALALGDQDDVRAGDTVVAVGFPGNASLRDDLTSTSGVVSVPRTTYRERALDVPSYANVIQTDAAINPGSSGGPLVDLDARLVGVNSAGRTQAPDGRVVQGQSYAIGVDRVRAIVAVLRTGRSIGWTGARFRYPPQRTLQEERLPAGIFVEPAVPRTPAARARLGAGEPELLVAVDGRPVGNALSGYCAAVHGARSGRRLALDLVRPGSPRPRRVSVPVA